MKRLTQLTFALLAVFVISCSNSTTESVDVVISNPVDQTRIDQYVELDLNKIEADNPGVEGAFVVVSDDIIIPSQLIGEDKIGFVIDLAPMEEKTITLKYGGDIEPQDYESKTYAEIAMKVDYELKDGIYTGGRFQNFDSLKIPEGHTDHNALFKYEGVGVESDKVAYRMYIDWRNRIDIFGKATNDLVLYEVGRNDISPENEAYHEMNDWGMDIFKVGNTLGIGTYAMYEDNGFVSVETRDSVIVVISENGPVKSTASVYYYEWEVNDKKYDLQSNLSMTAGSRLVETDLMLTNNPESIITGFAKHENTEFIKGSSANGWNYIALYGKQTLADDNLGIVLFYNLEDLIEQTEDNENYIVELKPEQGNVKYYFGAAWEQEPNGIKNIDEFKQYLENVTMELNNPINIEY